MGLYYINDETLKAIADAIRVKTGGTAEIKVSDFALEIENIPSGGGQEYESGRDALVDLTQKGIISDNVALFYSGADSLDWSEGIDSQDVFYELPRILDDVDIYYENEVMYCGYSGWEYIDISEGFWYFENQGGFYNPINLAEGGDVSTILDTLESQGIHSYELFVEDGLWHGYSSGDMAGGDAATVLTRMGVGPGLSVLYGQNGYWNYEELDEVDRTNALIYYSDGWNVGDEYSTYYYDPDFKGFRYVYNIQEYLENQYELKGEDVIWDAKNFLYDHGELSSGGFDFSDTDYIYYYDGSDWTSSSDISSVLQYKGDSYSVYYYDGSSWTYTSDINSILDYFGDSSSIYYYTGSSWTYASSISSLLSDNYSSGYGTDVLAEISSFLDSIGYHIEEN